MDNLHITLRFLGDAAVAAVAEGLATASLPAATARVGPTVGELRRGLVVVPVSGLDDLAAAVTAATTDLGQPVPDRAFRGHVTLARVRGGRHGEATGLLGHPVTVSFAVTEVVLVDSQLGPPGARHRAVHRFPTG